MFSFGVLFWWLDVGEDCACMFTSLKKVEGGVQISEPVAGGT